MCKNQKKKKRKFLFILVFSEIFIEKGKKPFIGDSANPLVWNCVNVDQNYKKRKKKLKNENSSLLSSHCDTSPASSTHISSTSFYV